jgi:hypothetical protein
MRGEGSVETGMALSTTANSLRVGRDGTDGSCLFDCLDVLRLSGVEGHCYPKTKGVLQASTSFSRSSCYD